MAFELSRLTFVWFGTEALPADKTTAGLGDGIGWGRDIGLTSAAGGLRNSRDSAVSFPHGRCPIGGSHWRLPSRTDTMRGASLKGEDHGNRASCRPGGGVHSCSFDRTEERELKRIE